MSLSLWPQGLGIPGTERGVNNVLDFGADPTGILDSQPAFAVAVALGGETFIPKGNYKFLSTLNLTIPPIWRGEGSERLNGVWYGTRIFAGASMTDLVNINTPSGGANIDSSGSMEDLTLDGASLASNALTITGAGTTKITLINVRLAFGTHFGLNHTGNHSLHAFHLIVTNNGSGVVSDAGVNVSGAVPPNDIQFIMPNIEDNRGCGVIFDTGNDAAIIGGVVEANDFHGVHSGGGADKVSLIRVAFEANNRLNGANMYSVNIPVGSNYWHIEACSFDTVNETFAIFNAGAYTHIINPVVNAAKIHWDAAATRGIYIGDEGFLDATSAAIPAMHIGSNRELALFFAGVEQIQLSPVIGGGNNPGIAFTNPSTSRVGSIFLVNGKLYIQGNATDAIAIRTGDLQMYDDTAFHFNFSQSSRKVTKYNNINTAGFGFPALYGLDNRSGITAADGAPITLYAVPAGANQLFDAALEIDATAFTSGTATYTMTYTENGVAQTIVVTATVLNVVTGVRRLIQPDASTNVTVQLTGAFVATVRLSAATLQLA